MIGLLESASARRKAVVLTITLALIGAGGALLALLPELHQGADISSQPRDDAVRAHAQRARAAEIDARFNQAVLMLHAKRYAHAVTALHRVLELEPGMVEAHVNMGYALIGLRREAMARDFFLSAIELRPQQTNAYYGLALALAALKDRPAAIGAMRTFIHLSADSEPFAPRARALLREWEGAATRAKQE